MHKNKQIDFGENNLDVSEFQDFENEFLDSYKKLIQQSHAQDLIDFNPFEKVENYNRQKFKRVKQLLAYAAGVVFIIGIFTIYHLKNKTDINTYSEAEIAELQQNTEQALLYFSKELNGCLAKFEDAKKIQQPLNEMAELKNIKINRNNPIKNIKFN